MNDTERRRKRFFYWKETIELKCTGQRSDVTVTEMKNSKIDDALMDHPSARACVLGFSFCLLLPLGVEAEALGLNL